MTSLLRLIRFVVMGLLPVISALGAFPVLAADQSPALKAVIAAADKEGKLELRWGSDEFGGKDGLNLITERMNKMFGTHIVTRFTPGPNRNSSLNAIMIAQGANQPSATDIFLGSNQHGAFIDKNKLGLSVDWPALLPGRIKASSVEADGAAIRMFTAFPGGILYNTQRAPYRPTSLADLLKPEWKGKIASTPYASGFDILSSVWGEKRTLDFAHKLSDQIAGLMRCNEYERIASGEFIAFAMDCTGTTWKEWADKGAPIGHVIPTDFPALRYNYMTVPKNAQHPNAAKLFIVYLHTPEGQKYIWETRSGDLHTYPDSRMGKEVKALQDKGVQFHEFDIKWYVENSKVRAVSKKVVKILSRGR